MAIVICNPLSQSETTQLYALYSLAHIGSRKDVRRPDARARLSVKSLLTQWGPSLFEVAIIAISPKLDWEYKLQELRWHEYGAFLWGWSCLFEGLVLIGLMPLNTFSDIKIKW